MKKIWSLYYGLLIFAACLGGFAVGPSGTIVSHRSPSFEFGKEINSVPAPSSDTHSNVSERGIFVFNETPFSPAEGNSSFSNFAARSLGRPLARVDIHSLYPFLNRFGVRYFSRSPNKDVIYWESVSTIPLYIAHQTLLI